MTFNVKLCFSLFSNPRVAFTFWTPLGLKRKIDIIFIKKQYSESYKVVDCAYICVDCLLF